MRKLFGAVTALALVLALVLALAMSAEAKTKSKHYQAKSQSQYTYIAPGGRQPIVIQRRSWLDPGPEVPVGTYNQYSRMRGLFRSRSGRNLPGRNLHAGHAASRHGREPPERLLRLLRVQAAQARFKRHKNPACGLEAAAGPCFLRQSSRRFGFPSPPKRARAFNAKVDRLLLRELQNLIWQAPFARWGGTKQH